MKGLFTYEARVNIALPNGMDMTIITPVPDNLVRSDEYLNDIPDYVALRRCMLNLLKDGFKIRSIEEVEIDYSEPSPLLATMTAEEIAEMKAEDEERLDLWNDGTWK